MDKIRLQITGLSYSQTNTGAYALILGEEDGLRSLPIIIGSFEAQAIAIELEKMKPTRPLTHDVFKIFAGVFGIKLDEVIIHNLVEGVFFAKLIFSGPDGNPKEIDARTSDAIALAVRFGCPIYAVDSVMNSGAVTIAADSTIRPAEAEKADNPTHGGESEPLGTKSLDDLDEMLQDALNNEDYELASKIRDEIKNRNK